VQWFKLQNKEQNLEYGKDWLMTEFKRLAIRNIPYEEIARKLGCKSVEGLFVSVGTGAISVSEVIDILRQLRTEVAPADLFSGIQTETREHQSLNLHLGILAHDRTGLLRDVSTILAGEGIYILAINTRSNRQSATAYMQLEIETDSFSRLARALDHLSDLDSVIEATRLEDQ
jgi:GTP pyrophosphokinase